MIQKTLACLIILVCCFAGLSQDSRRLTPLQLEIEKQQQRLQSNDQEERRDALMRLASMRAAAASRAALPALSDVSPIVRATATKAILFLDPGESAASLLPLLQDKDEFVRREAAYALGKTRSKAATAALSDRLLTDKETGVRGAAAIALGEIADEAAVVALAGTLAPQLAGAKRKREQNEFVLRAAATALGQIKSRAGTAALVATLSDEKLPPDVRREAARSLGLIGDPSAASALRQAATSEDPFLSELAHDALRKLGH